MEKESNLRLCVLFLAGAVCSSIGYWVSCYFYPQAASFALCITVLFAFLGFVKWLNHTVSMVHGVRWLHAMVFESFAFLIAAFMRCFNYFSASKIAAEVADGKPILLVHGYLHDSSAWFFFKRMLRRAGLGPIYTMNLSPPFLSIRDYAQSVAAKAEEIERDTCRKDLVLIGHSMGGLISAWYAANIASCDKSLEVITIGSPLSGTRTAVFAFGPNGREMRRGSQFVQDLRQQIVDNGQVRFFHVASTTDQVIFPASSGWIGKYPDREYILDDLGHMTLLFSPRIVRKIQRWMRLLSD